MINIKKFMFSLYNFISNTFYFKLLYLFISLSITTVLLLLPGIKLLNTVLIAWGLLLIIINFIKLMQKKRNLYAFEVILYSFLALTLVLTLFKYPTIENLKAWVINTMIFTVIFSIDSFSYKNSIKKELNFISSFFVFCTFILSSISSVMILTEFSFWSYTINYRFYNLFVNENSLGIAAVISFALSLYLLFNSKILLGRVLNILNCLIQLLTVVLSNCRSAYFLIIALIFVYIYVYIKNNYVRIAMICAPFISLIGILIVYPTKLGSLLSGRDEYWLSALSLIKSYSLTGIGNSNLIPMMKEFDLTFPLALEVGGLHNIYFQIATVNGLIALILIIVFITLVFAFFVKKLDNCYNNDKLKYTTLLGLLIGLLLVNLLESSLIYTMNFIGLSFWIYCGYLISIFHKNRAV